jgi:FRG domain
MSHIEIYSGPSGNEPETEKFNASTFIEFLRRSHSRWYDPNISGTQKQHWVFRGHSNKNFPLLPSAARPLEQNRLASSIKFFVDKLNRLDAFFTSDEDVVANRLRLAYVLANAQAIKQFAQMGCDLGFFEDTLQGLQKDQFRSDFLSDEFVSELINGFSHSGSNAFLLLGQRGAVSEIFQPFDSQLNALAQHHGVPTFLLDWTENPWTAAYFASIPSRDNEHDVCVWGLNQKAVEFSTGRTQFLDAYRFMDIQTYKPSRFRNEYLASQSGVFSYLVGYQYDFRRGEFYPDLEQVVRDYSIHAAAHPEFPWQGNDYGLSATSFAARLETWFPQDSVILRKVILEKTHLPELRRLLRIEGITQAHLMPSLDNLATTALGVTDDDLRDRLL